MKNTELRIGNFVFIPKTTQIVFISAIGMTGCYVNNNNIIGLIPFDEIETVSLTEEWILKFGFNCTNKIAKCFKKYHNEETADFSGLFLKEIGNHPVWNYSANNKWTFNSFLVEVQHVHQLQNLYFSITGSELQLVV